MLGANYPGQAYPADHYGVPGIYFDNASSSGYEASLSTYNWSHTTGLSSRVLIVNVSIFATGSVSSITYNGVNLTFQRSDAVGVYTNEIWFLSDPAYGSHTVTVNLSGSLTSIASAMTYANVFQTAPIDADAGATGTGGTPTVNITTLADGAWVVDGISTINTTTTPASGQTQREDNTGALGTGGTSDKPKVTAGATSMSWGAVGVTDSWVLAAIALTPASASTLIKILTGSLSFSGAMTKKTSRALTATLSFVGAMVKLVSRAFTATLSFVGAFVKMFIHAFTATLSFSGAFSKKILKALSGTASFVGAITRFITYPVTATLSFVGTTTKRTTKIPFTGGLSFAGAFTKMFIKNFSATLSMAGNSFSEFIEVVLNSILGFIGELIPSVRRHAPELRITLSGQTRSVTLSGAANTITLTDPQEILNVTLSGLALSATLSGQPRSVVVAGRSLDITLTK